MRRIRGLSLIETLVVTAIIGILLSLVMFGVQAARESARRTQCQNNLRQIALAVASYESAYRCFPQANNDHGGFLSTSLPFMEKESVYRDVVSFIASGEDWGKYSKQVPEFNCPSDSVGPLTSQGANGAGANYSGNSGSWAGSARTFDGVFVPLYDFGFGGGTVGTSDVTDGLSMTGMLSECLRADGTYDRLRVNWNLPSSYRDRQQFAAVCREIPINANASGWDGNRGSRGYPWISGNLTVTLHNHVGTPNLPSCYNKTMIPTAMSTVSSLHLGGVNSVRADGSLRFVSDSIDSEVWFGQGSRNGGEVSPTED